MGELWYHNLCTQYCGELWVPQYGTFEVVGELWGVVASCGGVVGSCGWTKIDGGTEHPNQESVTQTAILVVLKK